MAIEYSHRIDTCECLAGRLQSPVRYHIPEYLICPARGRPRRQHDRRFCVIRIAVPDRTRSSTINEALAAAKMKNPRVPRVNPSDLAGSVCRDYIHRALMPFADRCKAC